MNYKLLYIVPFVVTLFISNVNAQSKHPIDKFLEDCLGHVEGLTKAGSDGCIKVAREKWEEEVHVNYMSLLSISEDQEKQMLKSMHLEWIKYKIVRYKLLDDIYSKKKGGDHIATLESEKMKIVKSYALDLKEMYHSSMGL